MDDDCIGVRGDIVIDIQLIIACAGVADRNAVADLIIKQVMFFFLVKKSMTFLQYKPAASQNSELLRKYREQVSFKIAFHIGV